MYFNTQCGSCDEENANLFNDFFYSIFPQSSTDPNNIDNLTSDVPTPLTELNFTQYDVYYLDVTKATRIDGIGPRILKNYALPLCHPLHQLFQKCLQYHLNGQPTLSFQCLRLEKLVYDKIINFITESISLVEFGVLKGRSTLQQLLVLLNFVHNNHDQQVDIIHLDIKHSTVLPVISYFISYTAVAFRAICGSGSRATYLVEHSMFVLNITICSLAGFIRSSPREYFGTTTFHYLYERSTILCYCQ